MTANLMWQVWQLVCLKKPSAKLHTPSNRSFCRRAKKTSMLNEFRQNMQVIAWSCLSHSSVLPSSFFCRPVVLTHYFLFRKPCSIQHRFEPNVFPTRLSTKNVIIKWVGSCCESFFSKYYDFPLSLKPTLPSSNSIWNGQTCLNYFFKNS